MNYLTPPCPVCDKRSTVLLDNEAVKRWKGGAFIQQVFPTMTPGEREVLISGTHPECWNSMFEDEDEDEA